MGLFDHFPYTNVHELNLDWLLSKYKELDAHTDEIQSWINTHESEYNELKELVDRIYSGDFSPEFVTSLINWYKNNIIDIIGEMVKQVYFGVTDQGYFVAYIPESWNDIIFGTSGLDDFPTGIEYGHLTLSY